MKVEANLLPTGDQLTRFRAYYKFKRINEVSVKDKATFLNWIATNNYNVEKPNDLFVVNHLLSKESFIFILSSINLLCNAKTEKQLEKGYICIDSTYNLINCKFPLRFLFYNSVFNKIY